jgi:hypothetical protein
MPAQIYKAVVGVLGILVFKLIVIVYGNKSVADDIDNLILLLHVVCFKMI